MGPLRLQGTSSLRDNVHIAATAGVHRSIKEPGMYASGVPVKEASKWRRNALRFEHLDAMAKSLKKLEKTVKTLVQDKEKQE